MSGLRNSSVVIVSVVALSKVPERSFSEKKVTEPITIVQAREMRGEEQFHKPSNKQFWLALCGGILGGIVTVTVFITFFIMLGGN